MLIAFRGEFVSVRIELSALLGKLLDLKTVH
jgi:hypothetical protein